jgi:hypothetical protein
MPNWAYGPVSITGTKQNVLNFARRFIHDDDIAKDEKPPLFFYRSFIGGTWKGTVKEIEAVYKASSAETVNTVTLYVSFAWSAHGCLVAGKLKEYPECIALGTACKEDCVSVEIRTEEPGVGFDEVIYCSRDGLVIAESHDMPTYSCPKCGGSQSVPTYEDAKEQSCYECGAIGLAAREVS